MNNTQSPLASIDPDLFKWFVIYTKPRHELKVNDRLNSMGIISYCPTVIKVSQWSDRKKKIKTPALPSIIFVNIKEANRNLVFDCPGVVRYMFFDKKIVCVPQNETPAMAPPSIQKWPVS